MILSLKEMQNRLHAIGVRASDRSRFSVACLASTIKLTCLRIWKIKLPSRPTANDVSDVSHRCYGMAGGRTWYLRRMGKADGRSQWRDEAIDHVPSFIHSIWHAYVLHFSGVRFARHMAAIFPFALHSSVFPSSAVRRLFLLERTTHRHLPWDAERHPSTSFQIATLSQPGIAPFDFGFAELPRSPKTSASSTTLASQGPPRALLAGAPTRKARTFEISKIILCGNQRAWCLLCHVPHLFYVWPTTVNAMNKNMRGPQHDTQTRTTHHMRHEQ